MTRLIDANALLEELRKSCKWHAENSRELSLLQRDINIVNEQPTINAIPVSWLYDLAEKKENEKDIKLSAMIKGVVALWHREKEKQNANHD